MKVNEAFDEMHPDYTEKICRWVPHYQGMISSLSNQFPKDFYPKEIMDLGCGNGNISQLLLQQFPNATFHLVDGSEEMIKGCKNRFSKKENIEYYHTFFQDLSFPKHSLDVLTAGLALHHLTAEEKQTIYPKIYQWLKPNGYFTFTDLVVNPNDTKYHEQVIKRWEEEARALGTTDDEWIHIMEHYDSYDYPNGWEQHKTWMESAGFQSIEIVWKEDAWLTVRGRK